MQYNLIAFEIVEFFITMRRDIRGRIIGSHTQRLIKCLIAAQGIVYSFHCG
jgi:hypothetical protein